MFRIRSSSAGPHRKKAPPLAIFGIGLAGLASACVSLIGDLRSENGFTPDLFTIVSAAVGTVMTAKGAHGLLARSIFHEATLAVAGPVRLGGRATMTLQLAPARPVLIKRAVIKATMEEVAVYRAGTRSRTYRETVFAHDDVLSLPSPLPSRVMENFEVPIPRNVPATVRGRNNFILTNCDVTLEVEGWPDLKLSTEIEVLPEVAR